LSDFDGKTRELWLELNDNLTAFEIIHVFNKFIFDIWGFRALNEDLKDSFDYFFISNLMEFKCGNAFTLGSLYLILAAKLELPIKPVLLEDQLILAYLNTQSTFVVFKKEQVLFYINPYEDGAVFDETTINQWIAKYKMQRKDSYYLPTTNKDVIRIYLHKLMTGYLNGQEERKAELLTRLISQSGLS
jgi:regulator of sirC expression with transglutaminase-like and TPR domain